jgi:tRNA pseudouridine55 synthase
MNGMVVVDKPSGMTYAQVVSVVKRALKARKVGHTGTLDPFATGVLVCCVNRATRLAQFLSYGKKRYEAVMSLGVRTDTQDFTGRVLSRSSAVGITNSKIESVFREFAGCMEQFPPYFSALKHQGEPLYKLAREGVFIQKPARQISIYTLTVLDINYPFVRFEVACSHGTYVRTLCADIGEALGCGGHLVQLRRTESGGFKLEEAMSLKTLKRRALAGKASNCLIPMNRALKEMPEVHVSSKLAEKMRHGRPVTITELGSHDDTWAQWVKVTDVNKNLVAILDSNEKKGVFPYMCVFPENE